MTIRSSSQRELTQMGLDFGMTLKVTSDLPTARILRFPSATCQGLRSRSHTVVRWVQENGQNVHILFSADDLPETAIMPLKVEAVFLNTSPGDAGRLFGEAHDCVHPPHYVRRASIIVHEGEPLVLGGLPRVGDKTERGRLSSCDKCGYSLLHLRRIVLIGTVGFSQGVDHNQVPA